MPITFSPKITLAKDIGTSDIRESKGKSLWYLIESLIDVLHLESSKIFGFNSSRTSKAENIFLKDRKTVKRGKGKKAF